MPLKTPFLQRGTWRAVGVQTLYALLAAFVGIVLVKTMLFLAWDVVPVIVEGLTDAQMREGYIGAIITNPHAAPLALDLGLTFPIHVGFMYLALMYRPPYGMVIALIMAAVSWGLYFWEVGYFQGMLSGEYPIWYECLSFVEAPLAFAVARYVRGITSGSSGPRGTSPWSHGGSR